MHPIDDDEKFDEPTRGNYSLNDLGIRIKREDIQDFAKIGSDIFKKTLGAGLTALKDVKDGLPKEAGQLLSKGRDDFLRGLPKDVLTGLLMQAVDKVFEVVREHKLEISIRIVKTESTSRENLSSSSRVDSRSKSSPLGSESAPTDAFQEKYQQPIDKRGKPPQSQKSYPNKVSDSAEGSTESE